MKILIINQPLGNRGDESAHKGLLRAMLKYYPNAQVEVLFVNTNQDSINQFKASEKIKYTNLGRCKAFGAISKFGLQKNIHFIWRLHPTIAKLVKIYKDSDVVVCAPGGICMGGFQNWGHLFFLHLAKYLKKPLVYYGRSFGPFPTSTKNELQFKKLSVEILNYFSFLSIRDDKTAKLADSLGVKYTTTVDSAFLDSPKVDLPASLQFKDSEYIVFVPNILIWHYHYKNRITKETVLDFYKRILNEIFEQYPAYKIVMLPQTFNYNSEMDNDINFFKEIECNMNDSRIIVVPDIYSSDIQQMIISNAEMMIGARYHSVVFALNNNTPFIALSYEHKIEGLLQTLGKEDRMIDITTALDSEESISSAIEKVKLLLSTAQKDEQAQLAAKKMANNCFTKFIDWINNVQY